MLLDKIKSLGGDPAKQRLGLWRTSDITIEAADAETANKHELEVGKTYTIWVARKNGTTAKGKPVKAEEWFAIEKE